MTRYPMRKRGVFRNRKSLGTNDLCLPMRLSLADITGHVFYTMRLHKGYPIVILFAGIGSFPRICLA
jgi:hypothetical protein